MERGERKEDEVFLRRICCRGCGRSRDDESHVCACVRVDMCLSVWSVCAHSLSPYLPEYVWYSSQKSHAVVLPRKTMNP